MPFIIAKHKVPFEWRTNTSKIIKVLFAAKFICKAIIHFLVEPTISFCLAQARIGGPIYLPWRTGDDIIAKRKNHLSFHLFQLNPFEMAFVYLWQFRSGASASVSPRNRFVCHVLAFRPLFGATSIFRLCVPRRERVELFIKIIFWIRNSKSKNLSEFSWRQKWKLTRKMNLA